MCRCCSLSGGRAAAATTLCNFNVWVGTQRQSPCSSHPHTSTLCWATRTASLPSRASRSNSFGTRTDDGNGKSSSLLVPVPLLSPLLGVLELPPELWKGGWLSVGRAQWEEGGRSHNSNPGQPRYMNGGCTVITLVNMKNRFYAFRF